MDNVIEVAHTCPNCNEVHIAAVNRERYDRWQAGTHIQNAFPELTPAEREFLMTGICSDECWNEYLGPEPE